MGDALAPWHIIILLVVLVLLFGSRRLPGAAKSLGESMHIFKRSVQGLNPEEEQGQPFASPSQSSNSFTSSTPPASLPASDGTQQQLADMQRQIADLQRQAANGNGGQVSESQTSQPF